MEITSESIDGAAVARLSGSLDTGTAAAAEEALDALVKAGHTTIIVDLEATDFVSSAGLRILLATAKKVKPDGELKLCNLNPSVLEVFEMSGFSTIFRVFDNEDAALAG